MSQWIDFKELRNRLNFKDVFASYGVEVKTKGNRATGFCPLPTHEGSGRSPSFSADIKRGIWQCFGCKAKGNILDFACRMEGFAPDNPKQLRQAALRIDERFLAKDDSFKVDDERSENMKKGKAKYMRQVESKSSDGDESENIAINAPLDFELKGLDPDHPYLKERGFTTKTINHFGLGYCSRGMLAGRIAIPIHNADGQLVGYAGRLVDDSKIDADNPKYLFPGQLTRKGAKHQFRKSQLLYNLHRLDRPVDDLVIVEGFASVWWLTQCGFPNAVALMGSDCSEHQVAAIVGATNPRGHVWIMPDGDKAGLKCVHDLLAEVGQHRFVRGITLDEGKQPTDCTADELHNHILL